MLMQTIREVQEAKRMIAANNENGMNFGSKDQPPGRLCRESYLILRVYRLEV